MCPPDGEAGADRIEISKLRVMGTHGVLAEERVRPQPFELDVALWLDLGPASVSDRLSDTVDYGAVVARIRQIVETRSFGLLEKLAGAVADSVLAENPRVLWVEVAARKLRPPVPADVETVGVRVRRGRGAPQTAGGPRAEAG
jgi:dihydroneopterin aldolase